MAKSLRKSDFEVTILNWDKLGNRPKIENLDDEKIINFSFKPPVKGKLSLVACYVIWWMYIVNFLLNDDSDIYQPDCLYNLLPVLPISMIKRKKIVYDLIDFVADSFNWPYPLRHFFAGLENFCLKFTEGVIVVDSRKQELNKDNVKRLAVVTNSPPDVKDNLSPKKDRAVFTIYYGGAIYKVRGLAEICEAIKDLNGIRFLIAGAGPDEKELRERYEAQFNVEFLGKLSQIESLELTHKADLIPIFYDPIIRIHRLASPAKLFDAMMCGTPVLVNSEAIPVAETVAKEECGLAVSYGDINAIQAAIEVLAANVQLRTKMGMSARKAFEREYNWGVMEGRLLDLYEETAIAA